MDVLEKILEEIESDKNYSLPIDASANHNYREGYVAGMALAQEIIREHLNDGWIPVTERLPEEGTMVIGFQGGEMLIGELFIDKKTGDIIVSDYEEALRNISAWMPLPEPYKAE